MTGQEYEKAVQYIYSMLRDGVVKPGDRLPTERAIAETLGISRNSTREALSVLLAMGMVQRRQGSGNYVSDHFGPALKQMIYMMLAVKSTSQKDICDFRKYMEKATCAAVFAREKENDWYNGLEAILDRDTASLEEEIERDRDFHYGLIAETQNSFWITLMDAVAEVYREWIDICLRKMNHRFRAELEQSHRGILEGLKNENLEQCHRAVDAHYTLIDKAMEEERTMKKKLVIFDLDGTILDTLQDLADSTNYALAYHGFSERTVDEVRRFVGNGIGNLIKRAVPEHTPVDVTNAVLATFKIHYGEHCADTTRPYEGILPLLSKLKEEGIQTAVVSNKADFAVQELCERYFPGCFDFVVGEREGIRRKPCPDSVNEVLKKLQKTAEQSVYIGDSDVDVDTAANAGMDMIGVSWGFRGREFLIEHGANKIADKPEEIWEWLV